MKSWLKSLFGSGKLTERHPSSSEEVERTLSEVTSKVQELRTVVEEAMAAKDEITNLLHAKDDVSGVSAQVAELMVDVSRLEVRSNDFTKMEGRVEAISEQGRDLEEEQKSMARSVESVSKRLGEADAKVSELCEGLDTFALVRQELEDLTGSQLTTKVQELQAVVGEAMSAKDEIAGLLDPKGDVSRVRAQVTELMAEVDRLLEVRSNDLTEMNGRIEAISEQARGLEEAQKSVTHSVESVSKRLGEADAKSWELGEGLDAFALVRQELEDLTGPKGTVAEIRAHVKEAREESLGYRQDVERIREDQSIVQAAQEASVSSRYDELNSKMDTLDADVDKANAATARVDQVMTALTERSGELREGQARVERDSETLKAALAGLQNRFHELEEAGQLVNDATHQVDEMSARTASLSGELSRLSEQVELVEGMREEMSEAQQTATDVAASLSHLEAQRSDVRDAVKDLRTLRGAQEEVAGALENLRATRSEIERLQTGQAETSAWLAETQESVRELRAQVEQLNDLTANIDHTRELADRVVAAASDLDERRESFGELEARMSELRQIGTHLDERTNRLLGGLADADQRFEAVARDADRADELRVMVEGITDAVQQAAQRLAELAETHESVRELRTQAVQPDDLTANVDHTPEIADRALVASDLDPPEPSADLEVRMSGLSDQDHRFEAVARNADKADAVRVAVEEVVVAAQQAERRTDELGERVDSAAERSEALTLLSQRADHVMADSLREEKALSKAVAQLEGVSILRKEAAEVVQSLKDQIRVVKEGLVIAEDQPDEIGQGAVLSEATTASLSFAEKRITRFEEKLGWLDAVERELQDWIATLLARQESVGQVRSDVQELFAASKKALEDVSAVSDARRVDALLREIQAGLESLSSQSAVVDQVIATSGRLGVEVMEAEELLAALREERGLIQGIHDALTEPRREESETVRVDFGKNET